MQIPVPAALVVLVVLVVPVVLIVLVSSTSSTSVLEVVAVLLLWFFSARFASIDTTAAVSVIL